MTAASLRLPGPRVRHPLIGGALAIGMAVLTAIGGCSDSGSPGPGGGGGTGVDGVEALLFIQRAKRQEMGDVFQYQSYRPGGKILMLSPPSATGTLTNLTEELGEEVDINSMDLSFDAGSVVFSAKLGEDDSYHLYLLSLEERTITPLTEGPQDDVYPIFIPGGRIFFMTNEVREAGQRPHQDEYERGDALQPAYVSLATDGSVTGRELGAFNLSHHVYPTMLADGSIAMTRWEHLGEVNEGKLFRINQDMTGLQAIYGKHHNLANSYISAREDPDRPGTLYAIATSRDRTFQAGKLIRVRLNGNEEDSEAVDLTPAVPGDREPSPTSVGRYRDPFPFRGQLLVAWSPGPVQSEQNAAAQVEPDFGIYLFNEQTRRNQLVFNDPSFWELRPTPLAVRRAPDTFTSSVDPKKTYFQIGALDVRNSSLLTDEEKQQIARVRVMEGFGAEEGPREFGLTEHEGHVLLGELEPKSDGSFLANVPANIPVHFQVVDRFAMSLRSEKLWVQGRPGETALCGGCHESRREVTPRAPGGVIAQASPPEALDFPLAERTNDTSSGYDAIALVAQGRLRGIPWNLALQPIFDAKCANSGCHDGTPGPANPSYTITDTESGMSQTFTFDLRGHQVEVQYGDMMGTYSASHVSLLGPAMAMREENIQITDASGNPLSDEQIAALVYVVPESARESSLIRKLNPPQRYPTVDTAVRAFDGPTHPADVGGEELTPDEYYLLILMADMGGQYYSRENLPSLKGGTP